MFVVSLNGMPFQPSLMFVGEDRSLIKIIDHKRYFTRVGATTLSIKTLSVTTLSITTLSTTFKNWDNQHNETQHNVVYCYAECH